MDECLVGLSKPSYTNILFHWNTALSIEGATKMHSLLMVKIAANSSPALYPNVSSDPIKNTSVCG